MRVHSRVATVRPDTDLAILMPLGTSPNRGLISAPRNVRNSPRALCTANRTVPDVQPSCEFLFLGRGRRGDAASGHGVATGRDHDATGPPSGG
jgi:hypothetical protein